MRKLVGLFSSPQLLFGLVCFLAAFIPLYPKIPLAELIPGYIVRLRLEDVFVGATALVWVWLAIKKKILVTSTSSWLIASYALVGAISLISGIIFLNTIPLELLHIGKSGLHYFRYLEYFLLFFFGLGALKSINQRNLLGIVITITVIAISLYGLGQKYWQWPVFSTMNREYAKGWSLTLGEGARVQSTFGGHYDMEAYLVVVLPLLFAITLFRLESIWQRRQNSAKSKFSNYGQILLLGMAQASGLWLLFAGASKTSFLAYFLGNVIVLLLFIKRPGLSWQKFAKFGSLAISIMAVIVTVGLFTIGKDMATRIKQIGQSIPVLGQLIPGQANTSAKPQDLGFDAPKIVRTTIINEKGEPEEVISYAESTWSENAIKYGVSMGIRLDTLWPQAMRGYWRSVAVGSGYGTLNKEGLEQFTEADSTDNNFLRTLGETGLLGLLTFYGLIILVIIKNWQQRDEWIVGWIGGSIGLMINAIYIDVYAASKVAFTYWLITGITVASIFLINPKKYLEDKKLLSLWFKKIKAHWPLITTFFIAYVMTYRNPFNPNSVLLARYGNLEQNYPVLSLAKTGLINTLDLPNIAYAYLLKLGYAFLPNVYSYYVTNFVIFLASIVVLYLLFKKWQFNSLTCFAALTLIAVTFYWRILVFTPNYLILVPLLLTLVLLKTQTPKFVLTSTFKTSLIAFFLGLNVFGFWQNTNVWLNNQKLDSSVWYFHSIKSAQSVLSAADATSTHLITSVDSSLINILARPNYQVLAHFNQGNYHQQTELYQQKLSENHQVFYNNIGHQDIPNYPILWNNFAQDFLLTQRFLDCEGNCSFYSLSLPLNQPYQQSPHTFLSKPIQLNDDSEIIILGHVFENQRPNQTKPYATTNFLAKLNKLNRVKANGLILIGDMVEKFDPDRIAAAENFAKKLPIPIITVKNQVSLEIPTPTLQSFSTGENYFIVLHNAQGEQFDKTQTDWLTNELLKVRHLQKSIKRVFVVSYQPLAAQQNSSVIDRDVIAFEANMKPFIEEMESIKFYLISGSNGEKLNEPLTLTTFNNVTLITTGFGNSLQNQEQFLKLNLSSKGEPTLELIDLDIKTTLLKQI